MAGFVDHLLAEIQALERELGSDPRFVKLRELQRVRNLYVSAPTAATPDSPTLREVQERRRPHQQAVPRKMAAATQAVVDAATEYVRGRSTPVPLRELLHAITEVKGVPIGGKDPINNLSAILWRYGFEAVGRSGWRLKSQTPESEADGEPAPAEDEYGSVLFCAPRINGADLEIHGAATL